MAIFPSRFVADSSVLIDVEHGNLIEALFQLPCEILTTDFIVNELNRKRPLGTRMIEKGLIVRDLSPQQVARIQVLISRHKGTSVPDISCYILAEELSIPLLTGDGGLRAAALHAGIRTHGTLFVRDQLVKHRTLRPPDASDSLKRIQECGARLPKSECAKRYRRWKAGRQEGV